MQDHSRTRNRIGEGKIFVLTCITALLLFSCAPDNSSRQINIASYVSEKGEEMTASYDIQNGTVQVILPDKRQVKFYQAISASGARYTNQTGTFCEHQGEAAYSIGDKIILVGKVK